MMRYPPRFPPVEDIANLEKKSININKVDQQMAELLRNVRFAIKKDTSISEGCPEMRSMLDDLLRQFMFTHSSIRVMLRHAYKKHDYPIIADTASLVREQIEKIYVVVTMLHDPKKWIHQYLKNAWKKDYERYLLETDELSKNERFRQHLRIEFPNFLETQRNRPIPAGKKRKKQILVSIFAKRCIHFNWYYPDAPKPTWFKRPKGNLRGYLKGYFHFPSPWESVKSVKKNPEYFMFLDRWYREYKYYSQYSHILMDKLILQHFSQYKSVSAAEKMQIYGERKAQQFIIASNTVAATLCALIVPRLSDDFGTKKETKEYWGPLIDFSLLSKALWKMYVKDLVG